MFAGLRLGVAAIFAAMVFHAATAAAHGIASRPGAASGPVPGLPISIGGPFALVDHTGRAVTERDFRGFYMLVYFGYANCPGICPTGLRIMTDAVDLLGAAGRRVKPVLITVDPANDTLENLAPAVARISPRLIGLTGTRAQLSAAAKAYKVSSRPVGRSWDGIDLFQHGTFIYLMGPDGKFLTLFPPIMDAGAMATAIRGYMG